MDFERSSVVPTNRRPMGEGFRWGITGVTVKAYGIEK